jgi:ABC-type amino acid transport substrate-binding protein
LASESVLAGLDLIARAVRATEWMASSFRPSIVGVVLLVGSGGLAATPLDLGEIKARGTLRVLAHFDALRPEFFSRDPAAPGFDRELLLGFAALQGLKLEVIGVSGGSDSRLAALEDGRGDIVAGRLAALPERRERFGITVEVFPARFVLVTRRPTPALQTLDGLRRYRVGTVRTSAALVDVIETARVPPGQVDSAFAEPSEFLEGLQSGRVSAVVWGIESALPAQREDPQLQIGAFVGPPLSLVYAVRKEDLELLGALDAYLANARKSLTWNRLVVKYFGDASLGVLKAARDPKP